MRRHAGWAAGLAMALGGVAVAGPSLAVPAGSEVGARLATTPEPVFVATRYPLAALIAGSGIDQPADVHPVVINDKGAFVVEVGPRYEPAERVLLVDRGTRTWLRSGKVAGAAVTAKDLNSAGDVVGGIGQSAAALRAVRWTGRAPAKALPVPRGTVSSVANAINRKGWVIGTVTTPQGARAALWDSHGTLQRVLSLPGGADTSGVDLTDDGAMLVNVSTDDRGSAYVVRGRDRRTVRCDSAGPECTLEATSISDDGRRLTGVTSGCAAARLWTWKPARCVGDFGEFVARKVNNAGVIAGEYEGMGAYVRGDRMRVLPAGDGEYFGRVWSVNNHGQLLGDPTWDGDGVVVLTPLR